MSEVEMLNSLRERLVSERRRIARSANPQRPESWAASLRDIQESIDAVDSAIEDEKSLAKAPPDPRIRRLDEQE